MAESPVVLNAGTGGDSIRAESTTSGKQQVVTLADSNGNLLDNVTTRFDYDSSSRVIYIGTAPVSGATPIDTDPASTVWTIKQFLYSGTSTSPSSIKYASGVAWANRTTVTYT